MTCNQLRFKIPVTNMPSLGTKGRFCLYHFFAEWCMKSILAHG